MELLQNKSRPIFASEGFEITEMGMTAEGVAFALHAMRSKIYSDKILAVLREYLANAFDEHTKFNVQRPVEITMPTPDVPVLKIRDYGKGLCNHDVRFVFGYYHESTKRQDRDLIGGLGVGSKAGHAYSDQFTVTSWHDGTESTYACVLSGDGPTAVAQIIGQGSSPSDQPSGMEIQVPVSPYDITAFNERLAKLLAYLPQDYKLAVNGDVYPNFDFTECKVNGTTTGGSPWAISEKNKTMFTVIVGFVPYQMTGNDLFSRLGRFLKWDDVALLRGCVVKCGASDVSITMSREGLEFEEDRTIPFLVQCVNEISSAIAATAFEAMRNCKTLFEAKSLFYTFSSEVQNVCGMRKWGNIQNVMEAWSGVTSIDTRLCKKSFFLLNGVVNINYKSKRRRRSTEYHRLAHDLEGNVKDFLFVQGANERIEKPVQFFLQNCGIEGACGYVIGQNDFDMWLSGLKDSGAYEAALINNPDFFSFVKPIAEIDVPKEFNLPKQPRADRPEKYFVLAKNRVPYARNEREDGAIDDILADPAKSLMFAWSRQYISIDISGKMYSITETEKIIRLAKLEGFTVYSVNKTAFRDFQGKVKNLGDWYNKEYKPVLSEKEKRNCAYKAVQEVALKMPNWRITFTELNRSGSARTYLNKVFGTHTAIVQNLFKHWADSDSQAYNPSIDSKLEKALEQEKQKFCDEFNNLLAGIPLDDDKMFYLLLLSSRAMEKYPGKVLDLIA